MTDTIGNVWEEGRDEATYRGDSLNSVSHSELECFRSNPEKYWALYIDRSIPPDQTPALAIGSGLHATALLPGTDAYAIIPDDCLKSNGARNTASAAWKAFAEQNADKALLKPSELGLIEAMTARLHAHPVAGELLSYGLPELPLKATDPETGLSLRCRIDWLHGDENSRVIVDLKTYGGDVGDLKKLASHILNYGYCRQLALYRHIHQQRMGCDARCALVFLEKSQPHRVRVVEIDGNWLEIASNENREDLARFKYAREIGEYETPGINDVICLSRPRWADYENEYQLEGVA